MNDEHTRFGICPSKVVSRRLVASASGECGNINGQLEEEEEEEKHPECTLGSVKQHVGCMVRHEVHVEVGNAGGDDH